MTALPQHGGSSGAPGAAVQACENWIDLRYEYEDGTGVGGASFVIQEPNEGKAGSAIIEDGVLDDNGEKRVCLPLDKTDVEVFFYDDPEGEAYEDPDAETPTEEPYPGFFSSIWNWASGATNWVWGVIQGDFNEDATTSQIIVNTIITMIPVVDQVGDVRDTAAILYRMIWKEEYSDKWAWVALFITVIGFIPTLGSLAKGVLKTVLRNADIRILLKVYNWFGTKGNGYRWIKGLRDNLTGEHLTSVMSKLNELLDRAVGELNKARNNYWTPSSWRAPIDKMKAQIAKFRDVMPTKLREAADTLKGKLDEAIGAGIARIERIATRKKHTQTQGKTEPPSRVPRYSKSDFPEIETNVSQKQNRHIEGRPEYRGGGYMNSKEDAQKVLDEWHAGDLEIIGKNPNGFPVVRSPTTTGTNVNVGAGYPQQSTDVFIIKGTSSPSIVPTNPNWGQ
ncbi:MAG: hypothetical protein AB8B85_00840 [Paracoccaceae bacterium]